MAPRFFPFHLLYAGGGEGVTRNIFFYAIGLVISDQ